MRQLAAVQLAGNAIALWLGYYWLSVGEARMGLLLWSFTVALLTAALFLWMHGAGLAYPCDPYRPPFARSLGRLPALLAAAVLVLMLYIGVGLLQDALRDPAFHLASWLTLKLRKPVKPATMLRVIAAIFWLIRWIALPILLLPWIRNIAAGGFAGFRPRRSFRSWHDRRLTPLLLLAALWLPSRVLAWHPPMSSFGLEMASFLVRAAIAYLLFVAGLLTLEGMPLVTQRRRAPSP
jgi:hypothetical protein